MSPAIVSAASAPPLPVTDVRVRALVERQLPRLAQLTASMRQRVLAAGGSEVEAALRAHLDVVNALRFELLVSPGLRAGPRDSDEAAFRRQVAAVADCTESSWLAIRRYMEQGAVNPGEGELLASEFTMEFRALHRRVADAGAPPGSPWDGLQQLCETARPAQAAAYGWAESQGALRGTFRQLAVRLGGGLLERLKVLVAGDVSAPTDEMRHAQQARGELQGALSGALTDLTRAQGAGEDLLVWLEALTHRMAMLRRF